MSRIIYNSLPTNVKLRVGSNPHLSSASWCGYNPNTYTIPVFLRGICHDVYLGVVANAKATLTEPLLKNILEENPEAFIGDAFRHIEVGDIFVEEYQEVEREGESLGAISGHHLNIITETDREIEKWQVRIGHNRDTYAAYFKTYEGFKKFIELLEGHMSKAVRKGLTIIAKAVICSNPTKTILDDKDIARIFGRIKGLKGQQLTDGTVPDSKAGTAYNKLMQKLINKYTGKGLALWKNIQFYNPFHYSFDDNFEKMNKKEIYEDGIIGENKDLPKIRMQQTYTVAHEQDGEADAETTAPIHHLHRNDCLFALFYKLNHIKLIATTEESTQYWLGRDTIIEAYNTREEALRQQQLLGLDGQPIEGPQQLPNSGATTSASSDDDFEVCCSAEDLVVYMNPEDYIELKIGVARRGQMDVRAVNLDMLGLDCVPVRGMAAGHARVLDKRAFKILSYFQMSDIVTPAEKITWRYKLHFQFAVIIFKNFVGCLVIPSPHFKASPELYESYNLIGQPVEKKKG